jgi:hypothetical protein
MDTVREEQQCAPPSVCEMDAMDAMDSHHQAHDSGEEGVRWDASFMIPELPRGSELVFNLKSTWGVGGYFCLILLCSFKYICALIFLCSLKHNCAVQ